MKINDEKFNKWFSAFILIGLTVAVTIATAHKLRDESADKLLLLVSAFGSLMGVLSVVSSANGKIWTFIVGFIDVTIYGIMCIIGSKYGNGALHLLYFAPMQIVGFRQWKKRGAVGGETVRARRLDGRHWLMYSLLFLAGCVVTYFILSRFDKSAADSFIRWAVVLDVLPVMCNILGQLLMSMAYMEQWIFWIGVNISSILMWGSMLNTNADSFASIYVIKYCFYLLNALNGLRIWVVLSRKQ